MEKSRHRETVTEKVEERKTNGQTGGEIEPQRERQ